MWENETTPESAPTLIRGLTHLLDYGERGLAVKATRVCSVDGCDRSNKITRGWCWTHYMRWRTTGDVGGADIRPAVRPTTCTVSECESPHDGHGYCSMHLRRWRRDGDLHRGRPSGERHHRWAGGAPSYTAAHTRVSRTRGPAAEWCCARCACPAAQWAYDHADPNELVAPNPRNGDAMHYSADPEHYIPMCQSCHGAFDRSRKVGC